MQSNKNPVLISKFSPFISFLAKNKNDDLFSVLALIVEFIKKHSLILMTPLKKMQVINIIEDNWPEKIVEIYNTLQPNYSVTLEYGQSLRTFELKIKGTTILTSTSVSPEFMKKVKVIEKAGLKCICNEFYIIDELYRISVIDNRNSNSLIIEARKERIKNILDTYRYIKKPTKELEISTNAIKFNSSTFNNVVITGQLGILLWLDKMSLHVPYSSVYKYDNTIDQHLFYVSDLSPHVLASKENIENIENVLGCIFNYRDDVYINNDIRYEVQSRAVEYFEHGNLKIANIFKCLSDCLLDKIFYSNEISNEIFHIGIGLLLRILDNNRIDPLEGKYIKMKIRPSLTWLYKNTAYEEPIYSNTNPEKEKNLETLKLLPLEKTDFSKYELQKERPFKEFSEMRNDGEKKLKTI